MKRAAKRLLVLATLLAVLVTAVGGGILWRAWQQIHAPFPAGPATLVELDIEPGSSARSILQELEAAGAIESSLRARLFLTYVLDSPPLQAGEYRFELPATTPEVLDKLIRGEVVAHPVTLLEGWTMAEMASHLAVSGFGEESRFRQLMESGELVADIAPGAATLEGFLFPDTYAFASGASERQIVEKLVATFRRRLERDVLPVTGPIDDLLGVVTLASIVEREATLDEERPLIAGVYAHRLRRGMALYADPTVIYALQLEGRWDGNLRRGDLELDSPYNTYRYPGLPPGPICSPGVSSLLAAAAPVDTDYLYFVSRNDGTHVFAATLDEHNRNVEQWQRRYWRERWARERSERESG
ncbi:MAG TPA: endolytic transglycosylase MltG [Thermoanaerobaculia bacterium]|nr:endolytic transglycosylase MltG [Thermoanaerobaculia bacterium]